jgi:hypothetical protein
VTIPQQDPDMNRLALSALALALLVLGAACGDGPAAPGDEGPMTARIDGERFVAETATVSRGNGQVYLNGGSSSQRSIGFTFPDEGTGIYEIGSGQLVSAGVSIGTDQSWIAGASNGSGWIEVTTLTVSRIAGTFQFSLVAVADETPSPLEVTEGSFDVAY